jgi:hypothetical protein
VVHDLSLLSRDEGRGVEALCIMYSTRKPVVEYIYMDMHNQVCLTRGGTRVIKRGFTGNFL